MNCPNENQLTEWVDNPRLVDSSAELQSHLNSCINCRTLVFALASGADDSIQNCFSENSAAIEPLPNETFGRFVVQKELGRGAMGVVYLAYDSQLEREVAIKVQLLHSSLSVEEDERLTREGQSLARLSHANVVSVFEAGTENGRPYVVMEKLEGVTLSNWLQEERSVSEIIQVFKKAAAGLHAAHQAGLVHRDFKPGNLMICENEDIKVMDFGLVRFTSDSPSTRNTSDITANTDSVKLSLSGAILGTPAYMAPEQLAKEVATEGSDQFSFCVAFFEALCGQRPFEGKTIPALQSAIHRSKDTGIDLSILPPMPSNVRSAIVKGLSVEPADRFKSMESLALELATPKLKNRLVLTAIVSLLALLVVAVTLFTSSHTTTETCTGGVQRMARIWTSDSLKNIENTFNKIPEDFAKSRLHRVVRLMTQYQERWSLQHHNICKSTERKEQSVSLLDQRMHCLDRSLAHFQGTLKMLEKADRNIVVRSLDMVLAIPAAKNCIFPLGQAPDSEIKHAVQTLDLKLSDVESLYASGQIREARTLLGDAADQAKAIGYQPLLAKALLTHGRLAVQEEQFEEAILSFQKSTLAAVSSGLPHQQAKAFADLAQLFAKLAKYDESNHPAGMALALLENRVAQTETKISVTLKIIDAFELSGKNEQALESLDRVEEWLVLLEKGADKQKLTGQSKLRKGDLAGEPQEALLHYKEAVAILEEVYGKEHDLTASAYERCGTALYRLSRNKDAIDYFSQASEIRSTLLGEENEMNKLYFLSFSQENEDALQTLQQALSVGENLLGTSHPDISSVLVEIARRLDEMERWKASVELYSRAKEIARKNYGPDSIELANIMAVGLDSLVSVGHFEKARLDGQSILQLVGNADEHMMLRISTHYSMVEMYEEQEMWQQAKQHYLLMKDEIGPVINAIVPELSLIVSFGIATCDIKMGAGRERLREARQLARQYIELEDIDKESIEEMKDWLKSHPIPR